MTTEAEQRVARIQASIDEVLSKGQRFRKGDRQLDRAELASLRMLLAQAQEEVARERAALAGKGRNRINYARI
ncbi:hypothetical protein D9M72_118860 [compost metagenome]